MKWIENNQPNWYLVWPPEVDNQHFLKVKAIVLLKRESLSSFTHPLLILQTLFFPFGKCLWFNLLWSVHSHSGMAYPLVLLSSWVTNPELKIQHIHTECAWSVRAQIACMISMEQHYFNKMGLLHRLRILCQTAVWEMKTQHLAFWDSLILNAYT